MAPPVTREASTPQGTARVGARAIWRDYVTSGLEAELDRPTLRRVRFLNIFALITIMALLVFGLYNVVSGAASARPTIGIVEMISALFGALVLLHLRFSGNVNQAQNLTLALTMAVMTFLLYTGGIERTGIFWWFCFPAGAFYLKGRRGGWWWILVTVAVFVGLMVLAGSGLIDIPYSVVTLRQFIAAYLVVTLLVATYEAIRDDYEHLVERSTSAITAANQRLSAEVIERRKAQEAMQAAKAEAERANLAKSNFLSRMSHELRTPLNSILGFSQLMESDTGEPLTPSQRTSVQEILKSGRHLLDLINEVLDLARIEAGRLSLNLGTVAIDQLVRETVSAVKPLADPRGVTVHVDHKDGKLLVWGDPTRLRQVLFNLLSNAIKYNRDQGQVRVESLKATDVTVELRVTDTGVGIPEDRHALVFVPFERLSQNHAGVEGSGIGLAIAKQLVALMHGSISFKSTPGLGTCFSVILPLVEPDREPAPNSLAPVAAESRTSALKTGSGTILYVEDDLTNLSLVRQILTRRPSLRLLHAGDGGSGITMARAHVPDLILLDIRLPDMSGVEVLRAIRAESTTRQIPVVVVTASAMPHEMQVLEHADLLRCLTKPLDVGEFLDTIDLVFSLTATRAPDSAGASDDPD